MIKLLSLALVLAACSGESKLTARRNLVIEAIAVRDKAAQCVDWGSDKAGDDVALCSQGGVLLYCKGGVELMPECKPLWPAQPETTPTPAAAPTARP